MEAAFKLRHQTKWSDSHETLSAKPEKAGDYGRNGGTRRCRGCLGASAASLERRAGGWLALQSDRPFGDYMLAGDAAADPGGRGDIEQVW